MMKKFVLHTVLFLLLPLCTMLILFSRADGYTDPFYIRFTTPKQTSLILGSSRAAQGIQPEVLNKVLSRNDLFNFSFTLGHSRYGPNYLNLIKRKMNTKSGKGIFIVTIDPWSISNKPDEPDDLSLFKEPEDLETSDNYVVNMDPNYYYLLFKYKQRYANLIQNTQRSTFLHKDGWLEVNVSMDPVSADKRTDEKMADYRKNNLPNYKFSKVRYEYLMKTIDYLKNYGTVYLVRLPVHKSMMEIEEELMPDFNVLLKELADKVSVNYYDMTYLNNEYTYTDGNHLYKASGKEVTKKIGDWILELRSGQRDSLK